MNVYQYKTPVEPLGMPYYWIILAQVTMDGVELTGRYRDRLCQVRETRAAPLARALVWRKGVDNTMGDVAKAESFARENGYTVHRYDRSVSEPLYQAKKEAMANHAP